MPSWLNLEMWLTLGVFCLNVCMGWRVWRAGRRQMSNKLFLLLALELSAWVLCNQLAVNIHVDNVSLLFVRLVMLATSPIPVTLYFLSLTFPNKRLKLSPWIIGLCCLWVWVNMMLSLTSWVFRAAVWAGDSFSLVPGMGIVFPGLNMVGFMALAGVNFYKKIKFATGMEKVRLRYLVLAMIVAMVSIFFFNFFLVVVFNINNLTSLGSWLMSGAIVSIGGYALVRIRFSNFRFMLAQVLHIAVMGLWAMLPYALVVFVYQRFILSAFVWTLPLFFLWLVVFLQIYNKFGNYLIEKIVNHGRDWLHAKDELMASIAKELDYRDIIFAVLDFFTSLIKNKGSLIVAELFDGEELYVEGALDYKTDIDKFWLMYRNLYTSGVVKSLVREEIESSRDPNLKRMASLMRQNGFEVCFPLVMYKEIKGVVVMGAKLTLDPYYVQDVDLVEQTLAELAPVLNKAVIYQDVTDYNKNLQAKIDKATKRLSATNNKLMLADKLKDEFVSVASHELRTPMTAIKGYLWLVHTKYKANKAELNQRYIKIALDATERLIGLVNDMLTISRIEGNRFELNSQEFDLRELVQQIHQELLPIARSKKLDFVVDMPKKPLMVMADSRKISEVLHNLIGNALKFTIKGSVTLKCFAEGNTVLCSVIDTGVGIAKDDADKLFKKFARLEKSYVKIKETGTGLGLYISQQIMKKHSGGINYESEVGVGSVFTIDLPKLREAERAG